MLRIPDPNFRVYPNSRGDRPGLFPFLPNSDLAAAAKLPPFVPIPVQHPKRGTILAASLTACCCLEVSRATTLLSPGRARRVPPLLAAAEWTCCFPPFALSSMRATVWLVVTRHSRRPAGLARHSDVPASRAATARLLDACGQAGMPASSCCPPATGTVGGSSPWRVAGASMVMGFCALARTCEAPIRRRIAHCHLYLQFSPLHSVDNVDMFERLCKSNPVEELQPEIISQRSDKKGKVSSGSLANDQHQREKEQEYSDDDVEEIYRILSSSDDWGSIQQALAMRSIHFGPSLIEATLKRCKRNSRAALQFFSWVQKQSYYMPTTKTYNTAMKLAGCAKDFKHMRYLYKEMLRTGCSPTVDTWNVMVCQYGNADLSEKALQTFYDMKQNGFLPDKTTYNHMIMYLTDKKGRKVDDAVKIFQEMCRAGHTIDKNILFMYLSALCECSKIADARKSVACLCEHGFPMQVAYSIFLRSLCRAGRIDEALVLFDYIEKQGCSRDQFMYGSLIHAFLRRDQFEDAVAKLTEMKNAGIPQSTHIYTSFIVYYFQKRDASKALNVLKEMKENGCEPTVVTYSALIRGHTAMGMVSEAWGVFHQMKREGPAPDFETYSMFIRCLCKVGRSEDGLQLIHDMLDCGLIPSSVNFTTVVHGLNMEGKNELAQSVLRSKWGLRRQRIISK